MLTAAAMFSVGMTTEEIGESLGMAEDSIANAMPTVRRLCDLAIRGVLTP